MSPSQKVLQKKLYTPYLDFNSRPSKRLRPQLVKFGFLVGQKRRISALEKKYLSRLQSILEDLHNGSLIIDDIQDQSPLRRGQKSLHLVIGEPLAINCGNWIYFRSLKAVLQFPEKVQLKLLSLFINELYRGHQGQALDLGEFVWNLKQNEVGEYVKKSVELKTGALIKMALLSGSYLSLQNNSQSTIQHRSLIKFADLFGSYLQLWNDLLFFRFDPEKEGSMPNLEDFVQGRPTFFWSLLSQNLSQRDYRKNCRSMQALQNDKDAMQEYLMSPSFRICLSENQIENKGIILLNQKKLKIQKLLLRIAQKHPLENEIKSLSRKLLRF